MSFFKNMRALSSSSIIKYIFIKYIIAESKNLNCSMQFHTWYMLYIIITSKYNQKCIPCIENSLF